MRCLDENAIVELADGRLAAAARDCALHHVESCAPCRRTVARALRSLAPLADAPSFTIDRYRVIDFIGEGAMGVVYRAHDPHIDREVALKVVRCDRSDRLRVLREARALGRVSHPNVLAVFDAGTVDDAVFIASELIDGADLRSVLGDRTRTIAEVLALFRQAALGLHAAHLAGLVHLDFKPDNVLVDRDLQRVRVADFGLAAIGDEASDGSGTHGYMAPEQRARADVDARADQYAFCVSLHEALYGALPDDDAREPAPIRPGRLPRRVRAAMQRGLSPSPRDRFTDMQPLVDALAPTRSRGALVLVAAAAIAALAIPRSEARTPAPIASAALIHEPDPALAHARELRLAGRIETAAEEAREVARRARATHELARVAEAEILIGKMLAPSARLSDGSELLLRAIASAETAGRDDLQAEGLIALVGIEARDPTNAARARHHLAEARRLIAAQHLESQLAHAADWAEGLIEFEAGHHEEALVAVTRAYAGAQRELPADHPFVSQYRWTLAIALDRVGRHDEAAALYEETRARVAATVGEQNPIYATLLAAIGAQKGNAGAYDAAVADLETALPILREATSADAQPVIDLHGDLAFCLSKLGRDAEARAHADEALAHTLASGSPTDIAEAYADLGDVHLRSDAMADAQQSYTEGLAWARRGASSSTTIARLLTRIAMCRGEHEDTRESLEEALAIHELEGSGSLDLAQTELELARVLWSIDPVRAITLAEQAHDRLAMQGGSERDLREEIEAWLGERIGIA